MAISDLAVGVAKTSRAETGRYILKIGTEKHGVLTVPALLLQDIWPEGRFYHCKLPYGAFGFETEGGRSLTRGMFLASDPKMISREEYIKLVSNRKEKE